MVQHGDNSVNAESIINNVITRTYEYRTCTVTYIRTCMQSSIMCTCTFLHVKLNASLWCTCVNIRKNIVVYSTVDKCGNIYCNISELCEKSNYAY